MTINQLKKSLYSKALKKHKTKKDAAKAVGVSYETIKRWEQGR